LSRPRGITLHSIGRKTANGLVTGFRLWTWATDQAVDAVISSTNDKVNVFFMVISIFWLNLASAVQDAQAMQGLESESLLMGGEHSQKVKAPPIKIDSGSRDCVA
jgi:hypothetical protein